MYHYRKIINPKALNGIEDDIISPLYLAPHEIKSFYYHSIAEFNVA